jgi:hypothetical protein
MSYNTAPNPHATFSSSVDQAIVDSALAQVVTFNTTINSAGISLGDNTKIILPQTGNYLFSISAVAFCTAGSDQEASIWFRKNGDDVANSNTYLTVPKNNNMIVAVTLSLPCTTAGDYYELWFSGQSTSVRLDSVAAITGSSTFPPNQPASPSIIITVAQIG